MAEKTREEQLEGAIKQIKRERDIAIMQLHKLGYNLGEKPRNEVKGVWMHYPSSAKSYRWMCSACTKIAYYPNPKDIKGCAYKYCPNCGVEMTRTEGVD